MRFAIRIVWTSQHALIRQQSRFDHTSTRPLVHATICHQNPLDAAKRRRSDSDDTSCRQDTRRAGEARGKCERGTDGPRVPVRRPHSPAPSVGRARLGERRWPRAEDRFARGEVPAGQAPEGGYQRLSCSVGLLFVERCPSLDERCPRAACARRVVVAMLFVELCERSLLGERVESGHGAWYNSHVTRPPGRAETAAKGRLPTTWRVRCREGWRDSRTPGEAMSRQMKLVAALTGSQSEPDSGGHAGSLVSGRGETRTSSP